jgi:hypothetical protein
VKGLPNLAFEELEKAIGQAPELVFPAFNRRSLRRVTDELLNGEMTEQA